MSINSYIPLITGVAGAALAFLFGRMQQSHQQKWEESRIKDERRLQKLEELYTLVDNADRAFQGMMARGISHSETGAELFGEDRTYLADLPRIRTMTAIYAPSLTQDVNRLFEVWEKDWSPAYADIIGANKKPKEKRVELNTALATAHVRMSKNFEQIIAKIPEVIRSNNLV